MKSMKEGAIREVGKATCTRYDAHPLRNKQVLLKQPRSYSQ